MSEITAVCNKTQSPWIKIMSHNVRYMGFSLPHVLSDLHVEVCRCAVKLRPLQAASWHYIPQLIILTKTDKW